MYFGFKNIGLPPGINNEWFPGPQDAVGGLIYVFQIWAGHLSYNSFAWIVQPYTIDWTEYCWTELRLRAVSKVQTSSWLSDGSGQILLGVKNLYSWLKRKTVAFICRRPVKNRLGTKSWLIYWMKDSKSWFLLMKWNLFLQIVVHIHWRPICLGWQAILLSKMAPGEVGLWLPWWCPALVLPAPGSWGLFLNLIIFS